MTILVANPQDGELGRCRDGTAAAPSRATREVCFIPVRRRARTSNVIVILTVAGTACLLAGCAQTAWVRPETSFAETQGVLNQCNYEADLGTPASNIHLRGRHTFGKALAEGLMGALEEGIYKVGLTTSCMVANGFHQEVIRPSPSIQMASISGLPPVEPTGQLMGDRVSNSVLPSAPGQFIVLNPRNLRLSETTGPRILNVAARPSVRPLGPAYEIGSRVLPARTTAGAVDQRQLLTQHFMDMPDASRMKISFLIGACSAGDATACIMSEALTPDNERMAYPYR